MNKGKWFQRCETEQSHFFNKGRVYIIAEVGSNHCGEITRAYKLIDECVKAGVDAVKFQSWQAKKLQNVLDITDIDHPKDSPVIPVLEKYEVPEEWHTLLANYCKKQGIDFLSTPFDLSRARMLKSLGVAAIKISSGDLTYDDLLSEVSKYPLPLIVSTGMANLGEIEHALGVIGHKNIVLMHCVGAYPPVAEDANLLAIRTMMNAFNLPVGISDHYLDNDAVLAAVAMGASVVEKHVTLSRDDGAPDSPFAQEIPELMALVTSIRKLEVLLGDGDKKCQDSEKGGLVGGRRGLYAAKDIQKGDVLCRDNIAVVRPNVGQYQPADLDVVVGKVLTKSIGKGMPISRESLI